MSQYKLIALSLCFALLGACASQDIPDPDRTESTVGSADTADTDGMGVDGLGDGEFIDYDGGELTNIIYFDFDSYELRPDDAEIVARHGRQLADNSGLSVRLEGHADERGSREYNIGLGERRAQAVRRVLLIQGANSAQISTVSFGEERPVGFGSNEQAWAQNRRVEVTYTN